MPEQREVSCQEVAERPTLLESKPPSRIVLPDLSEHIKQLVFQSLNQLARSRNIAVILLWIGKEDHSEVCWDNMRFQSNGPSGLSNTCVFCGKTRLAKDDRVSFGHFVSDEECFRSSFVESLGIYYLPAQLYRPAVIIVPLHVPGSIDNAVLDLAWGLAMYQVSLKCSSGRRTWLEERVHLFAERLVRKLEKRPPDGYLGEFETEEHAVNSHA